MKLKKILPITFASVVATTALPMITSCGPAKTLELKWNDDWSFWGNINLTEGHEFDITIDIGDHSDASAKTVYLYWETTQIKGDANNPINITSCQVTSDDGTINDYEVILNRGLYMYTYIIKDYAPPKKNDKIVMHAISRIEGDIHFVLTSIDN